MWKSAGRAPSLRVFTLAFALQLRKKHGKTTVRVRNFSQVNKNLSQSTVYILQRERERERERETHTHTHTKKI
jgi:hypothetical protein